MGGRELVLGRVERTRQATAVFGGRVQHQRMQEDDIALLARHLGEALVRAFVDCIDEELETSGQGLVWILGSGAHSGRYAFGVVELVQVSVTIWQVRGLVVQQSIILGGEQGGRWLIPDAFLSSSDPLHRSMSRHRSPRHQTSMG
jgi:hypothetical protein